MKSGWEYVKWFGTAALLMLTAVAAFIYGKQDNLPALKDARVREKRAKLRRAQLEYDTAKADAAKADSEEEAASHIKRADTAQLRIVDLQKERDRLTGDYAEAAKEVRDEDLADADNRRRAVGNGRADSVR